MNIAEELGEIVLLDQLAKASEALGRAALQLQVLLIREYPRKEDLKTARTIFLEKSTDVNLCLRELDRAGIMAFDIGTAEKRLAKWQEQIREEKDNA